MLNFHAILQMGMQSLLSLAGGWACAQCGVLEPEPTVEHLNRFVLRVCIPCLQIWLLAVKTDMRVTSNWGLLAAFLLWSLAMQLLALALQAWHGAPPRPATHPAQQQHHHHHHPPHAAVAPQQPRHRRLDPCGWATHGLVLSTNNTGILGPVVLEAALGPAYAPLGMLATVVLYFQQLPTAALLYELGGATQGTQQQATTHQRNQHQLQHHHHQQQQQQQHQEDMMERQRLVGADHHQVDVACEINPDGQPAAAGQGTRTPPRVADAAPGDMQDRVQAAAVRLLLKNPLVWSTGASLAASALGSHMVLDPSSPAALPSLGFVDKALAWFAGVTAPVTLFTTGMWMAANPAPGGLWRPEVLRHLLLRATAAPLLMVGVARLLGFRGDAGAALVTLALLPVAQTAFVVAQQYNPAGAQAVSSAMLASLLVMLPQLMAALALLQWSGALA